MGACSKLVLLFPILICGCPAALVDEPQVPVPGLESPSMDAGAYDVSSGPDASVPVGVDGEPEDAGTSGDAGVLEPVPGVAKSEAQRPSWCEGRKQLEDYTSGFVARFLNK